MVEPVDLMMMTELDPVVKRGLVTGVSLRLDVTRTMTRTREKTLAVGLVSCYS
jgi:hypothetical protein